MNIIKTANKYVPNLSKTQFDQAFEFLVKNEIPATNPDYGGWTNIEVYLDNDDRQHILDKLVTIELITLDEATTLSANKEVSAIYFFL